MPWPFRRKPSANDLAIAVDTIRHLQTQAARQQFTMEIYNTAMTIALDVKQHGDEVWIRDTAPVSDPHRAATYLLPAAQKKATIAESMASEHYSYPAPQTPKEALQAYNSWTDFLAVFLARARAQLTCWAELLQNPSLDLGQRLTALDQAEDRSLTLAATRLNDLIHYAGISTDAWLSLYCAAFNDVRSRVDLPPFTETDFRAKFLQGLAGGRPRLFE